MGMTQDESSLQELAARLARIEQENAELRAQLANIQAMPTDLAEHQEATPVSATYHSVEFESSTPLPLISGKSARLGRRHLSIGQITLLVLMALLIDGSAGTFAIYQAFNTKDANMTQPAEKITVSFLPTSSSKAVGITTEPYGYLGKITEFVLPTTTRGTAGILEAVSSPTGITAGPDGNLWFTELTGQIGRITPGGQITEFPMPTHTSKNRPNGITIGPDGDLWFTQSETNQIGRITLKGQFTEFSLTRTTSEPIEITTGPDGNLWFTEYGAYQIGRITPQGQFTTFPLPTAMSSPQGITAGPDGNLWFTECVSISSSEGYYCDNNQIGRITTRGKITEFPISTLGSWPGGIITGPDGNLWFIEYGANQIGRITPQGQITEFPLPTVRSHPAGITAGPDGNLWFTEEGANQIGRITPQGQITESPIPTPMSSPQGITVGPDGNIWFTEYGRSQIGRITIGK